MSAHAAFDTAPFLEATTGGTENPTVSWATSGDGVRVRIGDYGRGTRGTVLCFPGRTEYIEKYMHVARKFREAGYGFVAIDWRGQGLADKLIDDTALGHVERFSDYQHDVDAMVAYATSANLPRPWHLVAHSMGGAIGLRALARGLDVQSAAFSAPMWDLTISKPVRPIARVIPRLAEATGFSKAMVPGTGRGSYVMTASPDDNKLTNDPNTFLWFQGHVKAHPELGLSGPTMRWLTEAFREFDDYARMPAPDVPCRAYVGTEERIVSPQRIHDLANKWPTLSLMELPGAQHEIFMEAPAVRDKALTDMVEFFQTH
ncbi:MAG: alpha/beta hydrolase [Pseudomonadota bacterium]